MAIVFLKNLNIFASVKDTMVYEEKGDLNRCCPDENRDVLGLKEAQNEKP